MTVVFNTSDADETRALGRALAELVQAGDLLMLSGGLGAGKTTFTQGLGEGMGVRGRPTSPTFIIAREHPNPNGPNLIHADAYRITDLDDLETLDLDASLEEAVTVVEWGEGKTEAMSPDRLEILIGREEAGVATDDQDVIDLASADDGKRRIVFTPASSRWDEAALAKLAEIAHLAPAQIEEEK
ncbi:tRNA (adenosine(37)-N6)-threonylcarbamoyltransferase complex ATPase subunit type 1 TsaE [Boudabousia liubingyangii]|uniref:tRNA (adenosine(37)-N6)-threonylcarbamoyltransferase complex ATPase subunit type 1 TsaE n=1 Tax=Boudabousia liubingyangii TaxID=1921764 RepID=UPI00093F63F2|nr:tRNA (adenosine(37)-N6)-threonylcarbamoyltransferase complex ATPase subunit type 1 TsaE [Boudabousia liubingyangii]OKL48217.1 tRNA (adenosine(37)-N6)-threonylcarbamoyltransferase complex ATPase subunit type 1 TsaE [Boudabousia liubingyangii]